MSDLSERESLVETCALLYDRRLTFSAGGNVSMRCEDGTVLITPSGRNKGRLIPEDMVRVDMSGHVLGQGKPSVEMGFHLAVYLARPDVGAVVHCHPLFATSLAVKGERLRTGLTPEGVLLLGDVPMIPYATPGSQSLVDFVRDVCINHDAMTMERHGALTLGAGLEEAFDRMEEMEFQARLQIVAGDTGELTPEEQGRIRGDLH